MLRKPKGIGLLSGGLDSALACKVLMEAGAEVICIHFFTGFCVTGHHSRVGRKEKPIANDALQVAAELGVSLELLDVSEEYLRIVLRPEHGYGSNMNPCIDCRIFMLKKAARYMIEASADFVFTGEVLGQRPMSQMKNSLDLIERKARLQGHLLRPLSAKLLPPTEVEKEGLIDREKLLDIQGRSRKRQLELARKYRLQAYSQPAGGCCFLTDEAYSRKFRDLISAKKEDSLTIDDIYLLAVGRHFRLSPSVKVIIGRDETENSFLCRYAGKFWSARAVHFPGPLALVMGKVEGPVWNTVAAIVARYSDGKHSEQVEVEFAGDDKVKLVRVAPANDELLDAYRI